MYAARLDGWDSTAFVEELRTCVSRVLYRRRVSVLRASERLLDLEETFIGRSVKKRSIAKTLEWVSGYGKPIQLFLSPKLGTPKRSITTSNEEIEKCGKIIRDHKIRLFVHAPYTIRLASEDDPTHVLLSNDLTVGGKMGARGVVVHTASNTDDVSVSEAEDRMYRVVKKHLVYSTESCPILLETPAKEGRELVTTLKEFLSFYKRFSEEERRLVRICVDTCHVFSAGYYPLDYLRCLHREVPGAIALVHFNGSATRLGGGNDLHSWVWRAEARRNVSESRGWSDFEETVAASPPWMRHRVDPDADHPVPKKKAHENVLPLHDLCRAAEWCKEHDIPTLFE